MIRWCAYCQRYLEDIPPYDDFGLTHGICEPCLVAHEAGRDLGHVQKVAELYGRLHHAGRHGEIPSASAVLDEGIQMGLHPIDLLMGLLQPALYRIGESWAQGTTTVAREHSFTAMAAGLIALVLHKYPEAAALRQASRPMILLVAADGNFHTLGIQLVELILILAGIATFTVYPGIAAQDVLALWREIPAPVVGFSMAMPDQMRGVRLAIEHFMQEGARPPRFILGGFPVRSGFRAHPELPIELVPDARMLVTLLRSI